jgi:WD40 repeat protein
MDGRIRAHALDGTEEVSLRTGLMATALTTTRSYLLSGSANGVICIREIEGYRLLQCVRAHSDRVTALVSTEGLLVSSSWDGEVITWSLPGLTLLSRHREDGPVNKIASDLSRSQVAIAHSSVTPDKLGRGASSGGATVCRLRAGRLRNCEPLSAARGSAITAIAIHDSKVLLGDAGGRVLLVDRIRKKAPQAWTITSHQVRDVVLTSSAQKALIAAWGFPHSGSLVLLHNLE